MRDVDLAGVSSRLTAMGNSTFADVGYLSARELIDAYRKRTLSPVEVTSAMLERIEAVNKDLNALYLVDADGAMLAARQSEERWRRESIIGLLDGVPLTLKDGLLTKGMPTFRGSAATDVEGATWDTDAPAVARVKQHGAVILGKTTMCDFGMLAAGVSSRFGITRNPWNTACNSGGSSSGAAAAIAAGIGPVTIGTDIVGSVRLPASFCGLVGHKPSQGRVPYYFPSSPSLVAGPLTRTVADAALMMTVLTEPDERDFTTLPPDHTDYVACVDHLDSAPRVGALSEIGFGLPVDGEVRRAFADAVASFELLGCSVRELEVPFRSGEAEPAEMFYRVRCLTEFESCPAERQALAPTIARWTEPARELNATDHFRSANRMMGLRERAVRLMDGLDFLILPSVPVPAYAAEVPSPDPNEIFAPWCNTLLFNLTEQPAISVNCGFTASGLPIGVQIVGRRFDDVGVLRLARAFEAISDRTPDWQKLICEGLSIRPSTY